MPVKRGPFNDDDNRKCAVHKHMCDNYGVKSSAKIWIPNQKKSELKLIKSYQCVLMELSVTEKIPHILKNMITQIKSKQKRCLHLFHLHQK